MKTTITETAKRTMIQANLAGLAERAYGMYQLEWMKQHGYTLQDLMEQIDVQEHCGLEVAEMFKIFQEDGFYGECWASYDEFLNNEFQNEDYMEHLLDDANLFKSYKSSMDFLRKTLEIKKGESFKVY